MQIEGFITTKDSIEKFSIENLKIQIIMKISEKYAYLFSAYSGSLTSFLILIYTATALLSLLFAGLVILYSNKFKSVIFTAFLGMITALAIFAGIDTVFKI